MEYITLVNGLQMPIIGTGTNTYGKENNEYSGELNGDFSALESAIEVGYRLIDTAISYRNEAGVGKTIAESGVPREEFFITTKIPKEAAYGVSKETIEQTVLKSLENLQTDYIDLYLLHYPADEENQVKPAWEVLESFVDQGKLKAIGVSNFNIDQLEELQEFARIQPTVNQIQSNPHTWNNEVIEYMQKNNIAAEAWGPLSRVTDEQVNKLEKIGENYGKTWGQVLLRYQIQRGVIVIPKSHNKERQASNLDVLGFDLTTEDMMKIKTV